MAEDDSNAAPDGESTAALLREVARVDDGAAHRPERAIGSRLGRFVLRSELGRGGMGIVYRARDESLGRDVALKVLPRGREDDREQRGRFLREARSTAAIVHPNVATIFEIGEADGSLFIAMELVSGESLRARFVSGRPLPPSEVIDIAKAIARGLAAAHAQGIVHRDLKPENVMQGAGGEVTILDFGLAKLRGPGDAPREAVERQPTEVVSTEEGRLLGTPSYMSPEQAAGKPIDARSDLFSLGVMLYEALTGGRPFVGDTSFQTLVAVMRDVPPPVATVNPDVPPPLGALVMRCLEKEPDDRPASANDLLASLEAITPEPRSGAHAGVAASARSASIRPPARRRRFGWAVALVALAVGSGLFVAAAKRSGSEAKTESQRDASSATTTWQPVSSLRAIPIPAGCSPQAQQAMRDALALWDGAETAASLEAFDRAVQLDPACASVHVHAAIAAWTDPEIPTNRVLASLRAARLGVDGLSARERFLLSGFDRLVTDSAPDLAATSAHLLAIAAPFAKDMELLLASRLRTAALGNRPEGLFSSLDPTSAFALWEDFVDDDTAGRFAAAETRLARCVSLPGRPLSCVKAIARNRCVQGRHAEAVALAQETLQRKGDIYTASLFMGALAMQGSEKGTVLAAQKRATALADAKYKAIVDVRDRAEIAIFFGDFDEAESLLQKADEVARDSPALELHLLAVMPRIGLLQERSRVQEAASLAVATLRDKGAWDEGSDPLTWQAGNWTHEPRLVRLLVEAGKLGAPEAEQRLARWQRARKDDLSPITLWGWTWSAEGLSAERAAEALRTAPPTGDPTDPTLPGQVDRFIGRALALGGRRAEAIPYLRLSANDCAVFDDVVARTVASLWLGEALEAEGDQAGACAAYDVVLRRWGRAKDSRSAGTARAHARALRCPSVAP